MQLSRIQTILDLEMTGAAPPTPARLRLARLRLRLGRLGRLIQACGAAALGGTAAAGVRSLALGAGRAARAHGARRHLAHRVGEEALARAARVPRGLPAAGPRGIVDHDEPAGTGTLSV